MASISTDSKGNRTVQFVGADRKRRSIRLGKASLRVAESIKVRVEALNIANITGHPIDGETARWVAERDVMLLEKLAAVKLIQPREPVKRITLGEFLDGYQKRRDDVKDATKTVYRHTINNLLTEFGATRPLDSITPADADDFRRALQRRGDDSEAAKPEAETLGIKLFDVATVLLNVSGRAARELKARWLKSPQLPKPIGQIYQSRRENLYSLDKIMAFVRQMEAEPADGWDAVAQRLRLCQLKPAGKAKRGLSAVTVARRCDLAKQFFRDASRRKLIPEAKPTVVYAIGRGRLASWLRGCVGLAHELPRSRLRNESQCDADKPLLNSSRACAGSATLPNGVGKVPLNLCSVRIAFVCERQERHEAERTYDKRCAIGPDARDEPVRS